MPSTFDQLQTLKADLLVEVQNWTREQQSLRPSDGGWSALQVLDHLARTEQAIQQEAYAGLAHTHSMGLRDRLGNAFLQRVFQSSRKVKVPASANATLPADLPKMEDITWRWTESRQELESLLGKARGLSKRDGVFQHPVAGWMNIQGVVDFFAVHIHHHRFQLTELGRLGPHAPS